MSITPPSDELPMDSFNFWFALKTASGEKDWQKVSDLLESAADLPTPRHTLTMPVIEQAALAGKPAIVAEMIKRGFAPDHDTLRTIIDNIEFTPVENLDAVADACRHVLAATPDADVRKLVLAAWRQVAAPVVVPQLRAAGMDVLLGGDVIDVVLEQGRAELVQLLFEQQVSPFAPRLVSAMLDEANRDPDMHHAWWIKVCADAKAQSALARFDHMKTTGGSWRAAAFLNPLFYDDSGAEVTLLGILAARGRANEIFEGRFWRDSREDALKVHAALAQYGIKDQVSLAPLIAALNRDTMSARKQGRDRFRL